MKISTTNNGISSKASFLDVRVTADKNIFDVSLSNKRSTVVKVEITSAVNISTFYSLASLETIIKARLCSKVDFNNSGRVSLEEHSFKEPVI